MTINASEVDSEAHKNLHILNIKALRLAIANDLENLEKVNVTWGRSREKSLAYTQLQEASMWLGMELRRLADGVSCYPNGNDTSNAIVDPPEPTAAIRKA